MTIEMKLVELTEKEKLEIEGGNGGAKGNKEGIIIKGKVIK